MEARARIWKAARMEFDPYPWKPIRSHGCPWKHGAQEKGEPAICELALSPQPKEKGDLMGFVAVWLLWERVTAYAMGVLRRSANLMRVAARASGQVSR